MVKDASQEVKPPFQEWPVIDIIHFLHLLEDNVKHLPPGDYNDSRPDSIPFYTWKFTADQFAVYFPKESQSRYTVYDLKEQWTSCQRGGYAHLKLTRDELFECRKIKDNIIQLLADKREAMETKATPTSESDYHDTIPPPQPTPSVVPDANHNVVQQRTIMDDGRSQYVFMNCTVHIYRRDQE